MKILITGITGFAGSHLAEYCLKMGAEVHGTIRWRSKRDSISHIEKNLILHNCDLGDPSNVSNLLKNDFDWIFHLAAQSHVPTSWDAPTETMRNNILCQVNIFQEMVNICATNTKIMIAGSSEEYGLVHPNEIPINENNPLRPLSPYGVSKVAQDLLGQQYFHSYGLKIFISRAFNHSGPRRPDYFVCGKIAKQAAEIRTGKREGFELGDTSSVRDFTDVRDMVRAYWMMLDSGNIEAGTPYNISSGWGIKIDDLVEMASRIIGIKGHIMRDPDHLRPSDVPILIGDSTKFREATGWEPEIHIQNTMKDMIAYWENNGK